MENQWRSLPASIPTHATHQFLFDIYILERAFGRLQYLICTFSPQEQSVSGRDALPQTSDQRASTWTSY
ncbi:hypothetical protein EV356DRAFT_496083 [Viridothelium virens]|uniref:Uncharacterized protein n=1 Tax=Viridothelium virens TaxID=1048519 RepID=A0A6A6HH94_VIRVR|nr:hypothetical protein EV356DRAFT_496083 [Viridothelium virens]